ncbi:MAG TPA: IS3 family transposase, partial [Candidatus Omnitrophica bacterium]|nr:IS3 family transposase [Candidatus Omnitrophota bacterium]
MRLSGEYPIKLICRSAGLSRSVFYYQPVKRPEELLLRDKIECIVAQYPRYGYRRVTAELGRRGYKVNHK